MTILMLAIMVVPLSTFSKWYFASTALHSKVAEQHHLQDWESLCRQWFQKTRGKTFHVFDVRVSTLFRATDFNVRGSEGVAAANVHPTLKFGILNQRPVSIPTFSKTDGCLIDDIFIFDIKYTRVTS